MKKVNSTVLATQRKLYDQMQTGPSWMFFQTNREFHLTHYVDRD